MNNYDIRVVRLIKSTEANPIQKYLKSSQNVWVCLGHFDIAVVDELHIKPQSTPLQAVQEDSLKLWHYSTDNIEEQITYTEATENNYIYPLYAIKQLEESSTRENKPVASDTSSFWNSQTNYMVITRLHCERETKGHGIPFSQILFKRLIDEYNITEQKTTDYLQITIPCAGHNSILNFSASVMFYDSLELGDIIGFIKCNSLTAILQVQRTLYETPCVSDAYTYCGINHWLFNEGFEPYNSQLLSEVSLEYVSTRFSVKQAKYAEMVYPELLGKDYKNSSQHFFVTGNADAIIDWRNCLEVDLLKQMKNLVWLDTLVSNSDKCGKIMYHAFNDVITRVGLKHCPPKNSRPYDFAKLGGLQTVDCPEKLTKILTDSQFNVRWKYPLIKLLGTLYTMSENCVMDDLSNLLIPGVNALLKRIEYYINTGKQLDENMVLGFLDRCTSLINDILHLENQLVQHPELMPVRYFIPAIVLGFEQKFISECAQCIENLDSDAAATRNYSQRFQPIIFPSRETNTNTMCYFDHKMHKDYAGETPLGIGVPITQLYQPWEILHILCHEVAHYCGNNIRNRSLRYDCITKSAAEYIIQLWDGFYHFQYTDAKKNVVDNARRKLANSISEKYVNCNAEGSQYLTILRDHLPMCVAEASSNRETQEEYLYNFLACANEEEQLATVAKFDTINSMCGGIALYELYAQHLKKCIVSHYKECYADIVMILVLNCNFADYYECVYSQECLRLVAAASKSTLNVDDAASCELHTDRLALVCLTISKLKGYDTWLDGYEGIRDRQDAMWAHVAIEKVKKWTNRDMKDPKWNRKYLETVKSHPFMLYAYEVEQLLHYLGQCAQKISTKVGQDQDIRRLRSLMEKLSVEKFDWSSIRDYLEISKDPQSSGTA